VTLDEIFMKFLQAERLNSVNWLKFWKDGKITLRES